MEATISKIDELPLAGSNLFAIHLVDRHDNRYKTYTSPIYNNFTKWKAALNPGTILTGLSLVPHRGNLVNADSDFEIVLRMGRDNYREYLRSPQWRKVREMVLVRDGYKCRLCNSGLDLHVHHRSYDFLGREMGHLEELLTLCKRCHASFHRVDVSY